MPKGLWVRIPLGVLINMSNMSEEKMYTEKEVKAIVGGFVAHLSNKRLVTIDVTSLEGIMEASELFMWYWDNRVPNIIDDLRNKTERWKTGMEAASIVIDAIKMKLNENT